MSVLAKNPDRSIAHQIASRVAVSPLGLRFFRDIGSRVDPTLSSAHPLCGRMFGLIKSNDAFHAGQ
jgi:hypothetical protein